MSNFIWWINPMLWDYVLADVVSRPLENEVLEAIKRHAAKRHLARLQRIADRDRHYALNTKLSGFERVARLAVEFGMTKEAVADALDEYDSLLEAV